jgi:hypothetical protein
VGEAGLADFAICRGDDSALCEMPTTSGRIRTKKIAKQPKKDVRGVVKELSLITSGLSRLTTIPVNCRTNPKAYCAHLEYARGGLGKRPTESSAAGPNRRAAKLLKSEMFQQQTWFLGIRLRGKTRSHHDLAFRDANLSFEIEVTSPAARRGWDRLALPCGPECMTPGMRLSGQ